MTMLNAAISTAAHLMNKRHSRGKKDTHVFLGLPYQMTHLMHKQHSNVGLPTTCPQIYNYIFLQCFLAQLQLIPSRRPKQTHVR